MQNQRVIGTLESFNSKPGESHAFVRIDGAKHFLPTSHRGVLDGDVIRLCANGERYVPLSEGTKVVVDINVNAEGQNPIPGLWAPVRRVRQGRV